VHVLTENEIAIKAIRLVAKYPGITTTQLIKELEMLFVLHPDDLRILKNRNDSYFSQKVRNLVSHFETNFFGKHVVKGEKSGNSLTWRLNKKGEELINNYDNEELIELVLDQDFEDQVLSSARYNTLVDLHYSENRLPILKSNRFGKAYYKDPRITKTYLENAGNKCEFNENHITFVSARTNDKYVEGHHLIPMKYQGSFLINIDRSENLVALCPNCHRQIHLGTKAEKELVLKKIFKLKFDKLKNIGIKISFEDLFNKFYS
jgi:predicted HNH restriction endonuclease